jgi:hypothetical protein
VNSLWCPEGPCPSYLGAMRSAWLAAILMIALRAEAMAAATSPVWGDLVPGPYAVGVTILEGRTAPASPPSTA